jgi:hypothetical protein
MCFKKNDFNIFTFTGFSLQGLLILKDFLLYAPNHGEFLSDKILKIFIKK